MSSPSPIDPATPAKPRCWRAVVVRVAFIVAVLSTAIAGFYLVQRQRGAAAWQAYEAEARVREAKLHLADYVPPPVPEERNFAAIPLFQDAFKTPGRPDPLGWPPKARANPPKLGGVYTGDKIDLRAWQKFFVEAKMLEAAGENPAADVLHALDRYAPQLEQLRLAGQRPDSRFPVNYDAGIYAIMPHLQILNSAARLETLQLDAHLALGDSAAAGEDFRGILRLYTALEKEPTLVAGFVRLAMLAMAENAVAAGLQSHQWAGPELAQIGAALDRVRPMDDYALAAGSERGFCNLLHEQFLHADPRELADILFAMSGPPRDPEKRFGVALVYLFPRLYPRGWIRLSQTRANRYFDAMLARVSQDPPRVFTERPGPELLPPMSQVNAWDRLSYGIFLNLAPMLGNVERQYAYGQTLLDETRLGCALERHRLAHGNFPAALEALVPAYLPSLPRDVMNGEPLHYRTDVGGGYTLYSVAWNLHDDGGLAEPKRHAKDQSDWVWTIRP